MIALLILQKYVEEEVCHSLTSKLALKHFFPAQMASQFVPVIQAV